MNSEKIALLSVSVVLLVTSSAAVNYKWANSVPSALEGVEPDDYCPRAEMENPQNFQKFCVVDSESWNEVLLNADDDFKGLDNVLTLTRKALQNDERGNNGPLSFAETNMILSLTSCRSSGVKTVGACMSNRGSGFGKDPTSLVQVSELHQSSNTEEQSSDEGSSSGSSSDLQPISSYEGEGWTFEYQPKEGPNVDAKEPSYSLSSTPSQVNLNIDGQDSICGVAKWKKTYNVGSMTQMDISINVKDERKYLDGNVLVGQKPQTLFIEVNGDRKYEKNFSPGGSDTFTYLLNTIQTHEVVIGVEGLDTEGLTPSCDQYYRRTDADITVKTSDSNLATAGSGSTSDDSDSTSDGSTDDSDSSTGSDTDSSTEPVTWNGWELQKSTLGGKSDELSIDASDGAVLDSGSDGYCGEAYFEKNFTVSDGSVDKLKFDYDVDGDKWAGEAFVSVNGDVIKSVNPSGEVVQESGKWDVYLESGENRVRFGIADPSSDYCSAADHSLKLEISGVTRSDTNFAS